MSKEFSVLKSIMCYGDEKKVQSYDIYMYGNLKYQFTEIEFLRFVKVLNAAIKTEEGKK